MLLGSNAKKPCKNESHARSSHLLPDLLRTFFQRVQNLDTPAILLIFLKIQPILAMFLSFARRGLVDCGAPQ